MTGILVMLQIPVSKIWDSNRQCLVYSFLLIIPVHFGWMFSCSCINVQIVYELASIRARAGLRLRLGLRPGFGQDLEFRL